MFFFVFCFLSVCFYFWYFYVQTPHKIVGNQGKCSFTFPRSLSKNKKKNLSSFPFCFHQAKGITLNLSHATSSSNTTKPSREIIMRSITTNCRLKIDVLSVSRCLPYYLQKHEYVKLIFFIETMSF